MGRKILHEWKSEGGHTFTMFKDGGVMMDGCKGGMLTSGWEAAFLREIFRLATILNERDKEGKHGH